MDKTLLRLVNLVIKVIWMMFVVASISGIVSRIQSAKRATLENNLIEDEIRVLRENNIKLEQNIRYSTSSAYLQAMAREKFGLGDINDTWIILPEIGISREEEKTEEIKDVRNWEEWLKLFTKGM